MASIINATTTNGVAVQGDNSGSLQLQTNSGTTAVTIDTSQRVGINTTSPTAPLDIQSDTGAGAINIRGRASGDIGSISFYNNANTTQQFFIQSRAAYTQLNTVANIDMLFATNNTERMRITSGGIAQINTTASTPTIGVDTKLMVKGGDGVIECYSNSNGANYYGITFKNNNANNSGVQGYIFINSTTVSYTSVSDYRLKENVKPMTGGLDTVCKLKPVTYNWKSDGSSGQGFLAHEVQELVPEAVNGEKDAVNEDGSIKAQGLDTSFLVATLTAAIQELKAELDATKAEVQALKGVA